MSTNNPLPIGTLVTAKRGSANYKTRIYNVRSEYDEKRDAYKNTYWLRNVVGTFDQVNPV